MARPKEKLTAARMYQAVNEAFVSSVELRASGNLRAAYDLMQTILATKDELMTLPHPWTEQEQCELNTILHGPAPHEARHGVYRFLGWQTRAIGSRESHSDSGRDGAAGSERAKFNRQIEEAIAEVLLPTGRGRGLVASRHLRNNHQHIWNATAPNSRRPVKRRTGSTWFKDRMAASQKSRAIQPASNTQSMQPGSVKRDG